MRVPVLVPASQLLIQLPASAPGKAVKDGLGPWALAPMWETQRNYWRLDLDLFNFWLLQPLEECIRRFKISVSVSLCKSAS